MWRDSTDNTDSTKDPVGKYKTTVNCESYYDGKICMNLKSDSFGVFIGRSLF